MTARRHLALLPDPAEMRRRWDRRARALERPAELGGLRIDWHAWEPPMRVTHIEIVCEDCGCLDDQARCHGLVTPRPAHRRQRTWPVVAYVAFGCLACRAVDLVAVETLDDPKAGYAWSNRGQQVLL